MSPFNGELLRFVDPSIGCEGRHIVLECIIHCSDEHRQLALPQNIDSWRNFAQGSPNPEICILEKDQILTIVATEIAAVSFREILTMSRIASVYKIQNKKSSHKENGYQKLLVIVSRELVVTPQVMLL